MTIATLPAMGSARFAASSMLAGSVIGGGVNAGAQYVFTGEVKGSGVFSAAITGGLTYGQGLGYSLLVNTQGTIMTSIYDGENVTSNVAGTILVTVAGFKLGSVVETSNTLRAATVSSLISCKINLADTISKSIQPTGSVFSSITQETVQESVDFIGKNKK